MTTGDDTWRDALKLAAQVGCDPRTAAKWLTGKSVTHVYRVALELAARNLEIKQRPEKGN